MTFRDIANLAYKWLYKSFSGLSLSRVTATTRRRMKTEFGADETHLQNATGKRPKSQYANHSRRNLVFERHRAPSYSRQENVMASLRGCYAGLLSLTIPFVAFALHKKAPLGVR